MKTLKAAAMKKDPNKVAAITKTLIDTFKCKLKEAEESVETSRKRRLATGKAPAGKKSKVQVREIEIVDMTVPMDEEELSKYAEAAAQKDRDLRFFRWEIPDKLAPDIFFGNYGTEIQWPPTDVQKTEPLEVLEAYYTKHTELSLKKQKLRVYVETGDRSKKSKNKESNKVRLPLYCLCTPDDYSVYFPEHSLCMNIVYDMFSVALCLLFHFPQVQCIMFIWENSLIVQSLLCTPFGHPAFTLVMGCASVMEKSVFSEEVDHLRCLPVKQVMFQQSFILNSGLFIIIIDLPSTYDLIHTQVITDVPWPPGGKETKGTSGYPTDVNWSNVLEGLKSTSDRTLKILSHEVYEKLAKNLCGTIPEIECDEKGLFNIKSPTGAPGITVFGDLNVLKTIESKATAKAIGLKVYGNNPGIVVWERPRPTEKKNNAPAAGGSFFMNMSVKVSLFSDYLFIYVSSVHNPTFSNIITSFFMFEQVNDPIYDWKVAENRMLPGMLRNLKMDPPNSRYTSNVLGPISYSEAQQVARSIVKNWDEGYEGKPTDLPVEDYLKKWFDHVIVFNERFKQPESHNIFKHS